RDEPFLLPAFLYSQITQRSYRPIQKRLPTGAFQIVFFNQIALVQGTGAESSTPFPKTKRDSMSPFKVFFKVVV
ncbi:hypothetical protein, partial [Vibrio sp. 10N.286.48.F5]|uniref:hypothetical protein n=1 Tax=Vibrio sp. 10N.286.48.F5 TaxID=3229699 RepID=UPI003553BA1E